jgi:quercetin dioxygenase-like cupin family protein
VHIVKGTMQPGDVIPWHIHSGYVLVTVTQGTLTRQESCGETTDYAAGQGWSEDPGDIHQAVNNGKEAVVFMLLMSSQPATRDHTRQCRRSPASSDGTSATM